MCKNGTHSSEGTQASSQHEKSIFSVYNTGGFHPELNATFRKRYKMQGKCYTVFK